MRRIVALVRSGSLVPRVRWWAGRIVSGVSPRDQTVQLWQLRSWMEAYFRFLRDPQGAELLHSPDVLLRQYESQGYIQADCDDAAILAGALARSIGFKVRLVTVGFKPKGSYQHIWSEVWSPSENRSPACPPVAQRR